MQSTSVILPLNLFSLLILTELLGIVPEVRAFLDSGTFDVANLAKFPGVTSTYPPPMKPGVYFRVYGDFGGTTFGNQNFQVAHYVGQTVNMQHRDEQHRSSTYGGKKSNHYRIARKAGKTAAVPIILQKDMPLPSSFLDIAEFSVTCLFESWYPILLHPTNMNTVGSYGVDFDAATLFAQLAKSAAKETGWNPKHTSFGLNWNTPIVKNGCAEQKWVSWFDPSKNMYMYRSRRTIRHSTDGLEIYWASKTKIVVPKELENAAGLRDGQAVHVVAELARNSEGSYRPHQFRFVRFPPSIGLNPELEKLSSLAVKIEWLDSNQWKSAYLEQSKIWATLPNPHRSVLQIHRKVLMMMSDITEVGYTNAPQWVVSRPTSVVQFLDYDHLGQKMVVKRVQPREIPWPRDWTVAENVARLRTRFPPNRFPEVVIGPRPTTQGFFGSHSTRSACDFCYTQYTVSASLNSCILTATNNRNQTVACRYTHATTSCQCCRTLNRPCTWTGGDDAKTRLAQGGDLEELGIALNFTRLEGSRITTLPKAPFDPDLESEEHTPVI